MWDSFGFEFVNYYLMPGLVLGCIYALGAIGITLTFGILRFANFAHGELMMTGSYLTGTFSAIVGATLGWNLHPLIAAIPALFLVILLYLFIDRYFYKPFRDAESIMVVIASFGMMLIVRSTVQFLWGPTPIAFVEGIAVPNEIIKEFTDQLGYQLLIPTKHVLIILGTIIIMLGLGYLLYKTRIGKAMRAVSDSLELARVTGIDVEAVVRSTWIVGGFCAVAAGVFLAMDIQFLDTNFGLRILLPIFAAAILGGLGNPFGAVLGGLLIGLAEELSVYSWIGDSPLLSPGYKSGVAFTIMILTLLIRPTGILKGRSF